MLWKGNTKLARNVFKKQYQQDEASSSAHIVPMPTFSDLRAWWDNAGERSEWMQLHSGACAVMSRKSELILFIWLDVHFWHRCHPLIHNRADNDKPKPLTAMTNSQHFGGWWRTSSSSTCNFRRRGLYSRTSGTLPANHKQQRMLSGSRRDAPLNGAARLWQGASSMVCVTEAWGH